ncbi:MAG: hypothetical protein WCI30_01570 [Clostridia bacterium]
MKKYFIILIIISILLSGSVILYEKNQLQIKSYEGLEKWLNSEESFVESDISSGDNWQILALMNKFQTLDSKIFTTTGNNIRIRWATKYGDMGKREFQLALFMAEGKLDKVLVKSEKESHGLIEVSVKDKGHYYVSVVGGQEYIVIVEEKKPEQKEVK